MTNDAPWDSQPDQRSSVISVECSSSEDFYDCELVEAKSALYSTVLRKNKRPTVDFGQRVSAVENYQSLPAWLKTSSLQRPKLNAPLPRPSFYYQRQCLAPEPPVRMRKKSWRMQYCSYESMPCSSSLSSSSPNATKRVVSAERKPTNFNHHRSTLKSTFTATLVKATAKVMKPFRSRESLRGSTNSVNSVVTKDGRLITPPPRSRRKSGAGSTTSINSFVGADGRLVTPPPRSKSKSSLFNLNKENLPTDQHVYNGSTVSLNRILTSNGGTVTPPPRHRRGFGSNVTINGPIVSRPMVR